MEQPSPTNDSKHLQEDTERAICRAAAEQEERGPEALLNAVCETCMCFLILNTSHSEFYSPDVCISRGLFSPTLL